MRTIIAFTLLVAGICASVIPETSFETDAAALPDSRFISGPIEEQIIEAIEDISHAIRDGGLDPYYVEKENYGYQLPVPAIFNAAAVLEDILFTGLSDIVVNNMNYNVFLFRLNFELELPRLYISARAANGDVTLFGNTLTAQSDGRVDVRETIVRGEVRVRLGISGMTAYRVTIDFNLGRVISNIRLAIQGKNYSQDINHFIGTIIPETLQEFNAEVNELISIILLDTINENLLLR